MPDLSKSSLFEAAKKIVSGKKCTCIPKETVFLRCCNIPACTRQWNTVQKADMTLVCWGCGLAVITEALLHITAWMKQLQGLGLSVLMIDKPGYTDEDRELSGENHSRIFANAHFHVSRKYALSEMHLLNHKCDSFVIGSDQVWNYGICLQFRKKLSDGFCP